MAVTTNSIDQMRGVPTGGPLGAEIQGLDLAHPAARRYNPGGYIRRC